MSTVECGARQVRKVQVSGCCRVRVIRNAAARLTITTDDAPGDDEVSTRYENDTLVVESTAHGIVPRFGNSVIAGNGSMAADSAIYINGNHMDGRHTRGIVRAGAVTPLVDIALRTVARVQLAGAGEVLLQGLDQSELDIRLTGSGYVVVGGRVGYLRVAINGSGHVDASRLRAWGASLHLVGSGAIRAHATGAAMARLSGPGNIVIFGNPPLRDGRANNGSSGDIHYR